MLFDELRGYEQDVVFLSLVSQVGAKPRGRVGAGRGGVAGKRGVLKASRSEDQGNTALLGQLQQKVNLEIVKETLPMRRMIYYLQLEEKRMRDEISWETCKLEHNVIHKINRFIEESNEDQEQSLINFKYTVNLETIKGIENVIHERTEIFNKAAADQEAPGFLTQPAPPAEQRQLSEETLLDINLRNVFEHVHKLRVFWAWKNLYMRGRAG